MGRIAGLYSALAVVGRRLAAAVKTLHASTFRRDNTVVVVVVGGDDDDDEDDGIGSIDCNSADVSSWWGSLDEPCSATRALILASLTKADKVGKTASSSPTHTKMPDDRFIIFLSWAVSISSDVGRCFA